MSDYFGIICYPLEIKPHPDEKVHSIKLAQCMKHQVIIGINTKETDLGIFFPTDGKLSHDFLVANKLYETNPVTGEKIGGYFGKNGRVKTQKFRGEKSEGFWIPISSLNYLIPENKALVLRPNTEISEIDGKVICEKYFTPQTLRAQNISKNRAKKREHSDLIKHFSTSKLRLNLHNLDENCVINFTEKLHGTSGRTGRVLVTKQNGFWKRLFTWQKNTSAYQYVSGTRNVIVGKPNAYQANLPFRNQIHDMIKQIGLHKGETLYYEIVGYEPSGKTIMPSHTIPKQNKRLTKLYGKQMSYTYSCTPGNYKVFVYRITIQNEDKEQFDLPFSEMLLRVKELGLNSVPVLSTFEKFTTPENLMETCERYCNTCSSLDEKHIREGVVLHIDSNQGKQTYKYKSFDFCELEGIAKNSDTYLDPEESE